MTELFYDYGILVNPKVNKDLFSGIARVKEYLKNDRLYIFKTCTNLIRELKRYRWGDGDVPKKVDDHSLDELRYFIMSRPKPEKKDGGKSVITIDKERLYRKIKRGRKNSR